MYTPLNLARLRVEASEFIDTVQGLGSFRRRVESLLPPDEVPDWEDLEVLETVRVSEVLLAQAMGTGWVTSRTARLGRSFGYLDGLERLAHDAFLDASWATRAIHEAVQAERRVELPVAPSYGETCELLEPLPGLPAGTVQVETVNEVLRICAEALAGGTFASGTRHHDWSRRADSWLAYVGEQELPVARVSRIAIDEAFRRSADRHTATAVGEERLRGTRTVMWEKALEVAEHRLGSTARRRPLETKQRNAAHRAHGYLVAAVRGGRGRRTQGRQRRSLAPADPFEDEVLVSDLRLIVEDALRAHLKAREV